MGYAVRFMTAASPGRTQTAGNGPYDYARNALTERNALFAGQSIITRCWVERTFDGRTVSRYGTVLERNRK